MARSITPQRCHRLPTPPGEAVNHCKSNALTDLESALSAQSISRIVPARHPYPVLPPNLPSDIHPRHDNILTARPGIDQRTEWDQARMGARRQCAGVAREMRVLVDQLHVINRHRLGSSSGDFALWRAIRTVRSGTRRTAEPAPAGEGIPLNAPMALPPGQPLA